LRALDAKAFHGQDRISYELLRDKMELAVEAQQFTAAEALVLSTLGGLQTFMPRAAQGHAIQEGRRLPRLHQAPSRDAQARRRHDRAVEAGLASGWMSSKPVLDRVTAAIDAHVVENIDSSPCSQPFRRATTRASPIRSARARGGRSPRNRGRLPAALRRFKAFIVESYRPKSPDAAGLALVPRRRALLRVPDPRAHHPRHAGTADPRAWEWRGEAPARRESARLRRTWGSRERRRIIEHLRSDPKYFFESSDAVIAAYRAMPARVDPQLPQALHTCAMRYAVPRDDRRPRRRAARRRTTRSARSRSAPAGFFTINAQGYASEAKWRVETLFLHEAVPGHHMQVARAAEIDGLHPWRSQANFNIAYAEGLGALRGGARLRPRFYNDPYQRYGNVQAQLFARRGSSSIPASTRTAGRATRRSPTWGARGASTAPSP
jgi:uncharacterized protein (DUF885 family)